MTHTSREYYTTREVAELMGVHAQSVRNWIKSKELPAMQPRKRGAIYIKKEDLEEWMNKPAA